ncbi:MAG TPA: hypothetical protein PLR25_21120, partial [Planctomycetaceae bacterium]|nr:hypothetical protein [Planctomycetaceae bacterium]
MVFKSWLEEIRTVIYKEGHGENWIRNSLRQSRRKRRSGFSQAGIVDTEPLETRVLLSATSGVDDGFDASNAVPDSSVLAMPEFDYS